MHSRARYVENSPQSNQQQNLRVISDPQYAYLSSMTLKLCGMVLIPVDGVNDKRSNNSSAIMFSSEFLL